MRLLGYTITRAPLYSLNEVHRYRLDIEAMEKLAAGRSGEPRTQYENILHTMREVLQRILEKI